MTSDSAPTNPLSSRDACAIAGLLGVLRGVVTTDRSALLVSRVRDRFVTVGLLSKRADQDDVGEAVAALERRFRFALGEYAEPPWRDQP